METKFSGIAQILTFSGIARILAAGAKHGMSTEATVASDAMMLEIENDTDVTVCFSQWRNPVKTDSTVLRKCPTGVVNGAPCEAVLAHTKTGDYQCTGSYCRKDYTMAEIDTAKCPKCGETLLRRPLAGCGNQFDYDLVCLVSGEVYPGKA